MIRKGRGKYLALAAVGLIAVIVIGNTRNQSGSTQEETPQGRAEAEAGTERELTVRLYDCEPRGGGQGPGEDGEAFYYCDFMINDCNPGEDGETFCTPLGPIPSEYFPNNFWKYNVYSAPPDVKATYTCPVDSFNQWREYDFIYYEILPLSLENSEGGLSLLDQILLDSLEQEEMQQRDRLNRIQCRSDRGSSIEIEPISKPWP